MRYLVQIAAFWLIVIVAIRLAVCFPRSSLARVFFARIGPMRIRGQSEPEYLRDWARCAGNWFVQAALLFFAGWLAQQFDAVLVGSLAFAVFWAVVVPLLGTAALIVALSAFARSLWVERVGPKAASSSGQERHA